ncbi:MAG: YcxB family protein [Firmicutes bacterium]|nr:YcxB family protein [Bacillota bacterium]
MQPIVEFTEYPDYEAYRQFNTFARKRLPIAWFNWVVVYGVSPVLSLTMLLLIWHSGMVNAFTVGYPLLSVLLIVFQATAMRRGFKQHGKSFISERTAFFEDYYATVTACQNSNHEASYRYDDIVMAYETAAAFYLKKSTGRRWHFIPKKFLAPGQAELLRELFARKFGEKFKMK